MSPSSAALTIFALISSPIPVVFFFFSSRRRHTRWPRDWSSDVCSSDLGRSLLARPAPARRRPGVAAGPGRSRDAVADDGVLAQGGEQLAGEVAGEAGDASGAQAHPLRMGARGDDQVVRSGDGVEPGAGR